MPFRYRFSLSTVLLTTTCFALAIGWFSTVDRRRFDPFAFPNGVSDAAIRESPITISLDESGDFRSGSGWNLSVNSAGQAQLTVHSYPKPTTQEFQVSKTQLE
jgi:hypothetical protein